jgi:hypothetical protein
MNFIFKIFLVSTFLDELGPPSGGPFFVAFSLDPTTSSFPEFFLKNSKGIQLAYGSP